jgi:hypothetical protein
MKVAVYPFWKVWYVANPACAEIMERLARSPKEVDALPLRNNTIPTTSPMECENFS